MFWKFLFSSVGLAYVIKRRLCISGRWQEWNAALANDFTTTNLTWFIILVYFWHTHAGWAEEMFYGTLLWCQARNRLADLASEPRHFFFFFFGLRSFSDMENYDNGPAMSSMLASQLSYNPNMDRISLRFIIIPPSTPTGLPDPRQIIQPIHSPCSFWGAWNALFLFQAPFSWSH